MSYLAVDLDGEEFIYEYKPTRDEESKCFRAGDEYDDNYVLLPKGSIEKLIGKKMTWNNEPYEYLGDI